MKISKVCLRNYRRLEDVEIDFEPEETVFVGPNNSGKTSATTAFRLFLNNPDFKIHDFSVSKISIIDTFGFSDDEVDIVDFPSIEMDLWFSINPEVEFGSVFSLVSNVSALLDKVGIRIKYRVKDPTKLKTEYSSFYPPQDDGSRKKSLSHFLSLPGNLSRHFSLVYFTLEETADEILAHPMEPDEAKKTLGSLVRIDFVDAQRNIDDHEAARSNRLSTAFATFYKKNLQQAEVSEAANQVIDENNENLNKHYKEHFQGLMDVIGSLGVPSVNDRQLKLISSLTPEVALQGNTSLLYVDPDLNHDLPEAYNGLGFKNLIFMAIQVSHYHLQWINTEVKRPFCQIIFIEEPEAHLHSQVQQTFISNIWKIVRKAAEDSKEPGMVPQIGITTHSSHILDAVEFGKVRYFKRCVLAGENEKVVKTLNASKVLSLRGFKPSSTSASGELENEVVTLNFLKKYMKLTHCDLFFSDAAVLVEGTVEKLLLPEMINKDAPELNRAYLTTLEVGGAYASRFVSLLKFLGIPYLVITDLDSVNPADNRKTCRADTNGAVTSNSSLKFFFNKPSVQELSLMTEEERLHSEGLCYVAFQQPTVVDDYEAGSTMLGRTFEETFIYHNIELFKDNRLPSVVQFDGSHEDDYQAVYEAIRASTFKKTEFALDVASSYEPWATPSYISNGLKWLEAMTCANTPENV